MNQLPKFDRRRSHIKECPCGKSNDDGKFAPFVGHDDKGYCHSCGKLFPIESNQENYNLIQSPWNRQNQNRATIKHIDRSFSTLPNEYVELSMQGSEENNLLKFLLTRFNNSEVEQVKSLYKIGNSNRVSGATVFWYMDKEGKVRSGKIMKYDPQTGNRIKDGKFNITWAHKLTGNEDFKFKQCLYGEHLLKDDVKKPVAIVESEKTAIIASICNPDFFWLATGGIQNFNWELLQPVKDRKIIVYPDLGAFIKWKEIADGLSSEMRIKVSEILEHNATPEEQALKLDIADFLLKNKEY